MLFWAGIVWYRVSANHIVRCYKLKKLKSYMRFTSYSTFNKDSSLPFNWCKDEFESLWKLKNEKNLVIQKADKGNTIVILDKDSYLKSVETLLKDSSKLKSIPVMLDIMLCLILCLMYSVSMMLLVLKKETPIFWKNLKTRTQSVKKPIIS